MGYFKKIKEYLDGRCADLIVVGTGVVIIGSDNTILLGRRTDNGMWCPPGGTLEAGESLEDCAMREVKEEVGIELEEDELLQCHTYATKDKVVKDGMNICIVSVGYIVRRDIDISRLSVDTKEFSEIKRFKPEEVQDIYSEMTEYAQVEVSKALSIIKEELQ